MENQDININPYESGKAHKVDVGPSTRANVWDRFSSLNKKSGNNFRVQRNETPQEMEIDFEASLDEAALAEKEFDDPEASAPQDKGIFGGMSSNEGDEIDLSRSSADVMAVMDTPTAHEEVKPGTPTPFLRDEQETASSPPVAGESKQQQFSLQVIQTEKLPNGLARFIHRMLDSGVSVTQVENALSLIFEDRKSPADEMVRMFSRLFGLVELGKDYVAPNDEDAEMLVQAVAAITEFDVATSERVKDSVDRNDLCVDFYNLAEIRLRGDEPGSPSIVGRLTAIFPSYYNPLPFESVVLRKRSENDATALSQKLLNYDKRGSAKTGKTFVEGDYVVISYQIRVGDVAKVAYCLSPLNAGLELKYPVASKELRDRAVVGVVDGFQVADKDVRDRKTNVVYATEPFVLTAKVLTKKGKSNSRDVVLDDGTVIRPNPLPIYFLEPASAFLTGSFKRQALTRKNYAEKIDSILQTRAVIEAETKMGAMPNFSVQENPTPEASNIPSWF